MAARDDTASLDEESAPRGVGTADTLAADGRVSQPAVAADPAAPAGQALGRYRLREVLGAGGMGVVYRAHDPVLDRNIALKVVHAERASVEGQARLVREAKAMARLQHPN